MCQLGKKSVFTCFPTNCIPIVTRCGFQIVWGGSRLGALENGTEPRYDMRSPTVGIIGVHGGKSWVCADKKRRNCLLPGLAVTTSRV